MSENNALRRMVSVRNRVLLALVGLSQPITANELAVEVMKLQGVKIASIPKRLPEMKGYGHVRVVEHRLCRVTNERAQAFVITSLGIEHLRNKELYQGSAIARYESVTTAANKTNNAAKMKAVAQNNKPTPMPANKDVGRAALMRARQALG